MKSNSNGFTLLEIIVVMVLIALAGSLVFLNVGKSRSSKEGTLFAKEMVSLCKQARRMAVASGIPITLYISSSQRSCWITDGKKIKIPEEMLIEGEGVALMDEDIYGIRFYPDGSTGGGTLTLSLSDRVIHEFRVDRLTGLITPVRSDAS